MKLLDLLFDRRCSLCRTHIDEGAVCKECDDKLKACLKVRRRTLKDKTCSLQAFYLFDYDLPIVKSLLFALKRSANSDLFRYAAELYAMAVPESFSGSVTCCPRRNTSKRAYGYDQVETPCRILCKAQKERLEYVRLIARRGFSREQKGLSEKERRHNVKGKFKAVKKDIPKNILIVDDCVTTGSTVLSCADELRRCCNDVNITVISLASQNVFARE